ncbi:ATP-grasp domain-containing protein [Streptomyces shaanxiensis]|uniref:ATP-grasp domain-containing protein n=1 Tax=Streptomyces shaanxiensis TaxID=653357 RepID=A0ABP7V9B0_9ACTN
MRTHDDGLILLAHRIPAQVTPVSEWLAEVADRVVLITSEEAGPGYAGQFGEVIPVADYSGSDTVIAHVDRLCAERTVSAVVHGTEDDILRLARARDRHGIAGLSGADALVFRDKHAMKAAVAAAVPTPRFLAPAGRADAEEFAERVGWPVVVKPRLGYGSRGVAVVHDVGELTAQLAGHDPDDVLIEAYLPGAVHHVDGFMREGEVLFALPSRYVNSCLSFADGESLGSAQLDEHDPLAERLVAFAERAVAALPPTGFTPFHLEVFLHEDTQELYFCEIGARLGGGHVYETLTLSTGVNPVELWFRDQAGVSCGELPVSRGTECYGWLLVPPRRGTLEEITDIPLPDSVVQCHLPDEVPAAHTAATASTDAVVSFVVRGTDNAAVEAALHACARWASDALRWSV